MTAFAFFFFFASFLIYTGQCFVLPSFPPKAAGGCYETPRKNNGEGPLTDNALLQKLIDKMESMDKRFESMENKLDERFESVEKRFNGMDHRFDGMDHRFNGMDKQFDGVGKELTTLNQRTGLLVHYIEPTHRTFS